MTMLSVFAMGKVDLLVLRLNNVAWQGGKCLVLFFFVSCEFIFAIGCPSSFLQC